MGSGLSKPRSGTGTPPKIVVKNYSPEIGQTQNSEIAAQIPIGDNNSNSSSEHEARFQNQTDSNSEVSDKEFSPRSVIDEFVKFAASEVRPTQCYNSGPQKLSMYDFGRLHVETRSSESDSDVNSVHSSQNNEETSISPSPKSWIKELQEGIEGLAVTKAPTSIDPPDLSFASEMPLFEDAVYGNSARTPKYNEMNDEFEKIAITLLEGKSKSFGTAHGINVKLLGEENATSEEDESENEAVVEQTNVPKNSSDSDRPESSNTCRNAESFESVHADHNAAGDPDCSDSPKFWSKLPGARSSGSQIPSFIIVESAIVSTRPKTPMTHPKPKTPIRTSNARNSVSAQEWRSQSWGKVNQTSFSCERFHGTNRFRPKSAVSHFKKQCEQPPAEASDLYPEEVEDEEEEESDSDASAEDEQDEENNDLSPDTNAIADDSNSDESLDKYFSYKLRPKTSNQNRESNSSFKCQDKPSADADAATSKNSKPYEFHLCDYDSDLSSNEERGKFVQIRPTGQVIGWYSKSEPSALSKYETYSNGSIGSFSGSNACDETDDDDNEHEQGDGQETQPAEGKETERQENDKDFNVPGPAGDNSNQQKKSKRSRGLLCRKLSQFLTAVKGNQ